MTSDVSVRMPGDLSLPHQYFGMFSGTDLLRIGIPAAGGVMLGFPPTTMQSLMVLIAAVGLGTVLATVQPHGTPLEIHLYRRCIYYLASHRLGDSALTIRNYRTVETGDGQAIAILKISPTNLELQTTAEHRALHSTYQQLLESISYPIELHSRQREHSLADYITTIADTGQADTSLQQRLQRAYIAYTQYLNSDQLVTTDHYIVVRTTATGSDRFETGGRSRRVLERVRSLLSVESRDTQSTAADEHADTSNHLSELEQRVTTLQQSLNRSALEARRLTGSRLVNTVEQLRCGQPDHTVDGVHTARGEYRQTIAVTEFPRTVSFAWPHTVLGVDGLVDITQVVTPQSPADTVGKLRRTINRLDAEITSQQAAGYGGTNEYEARRADADWMLDTLADRNDTPVQYACYITVHASDTDRCMRTLDAVKTRLQTLQCTIDPLRYRTRAAYRSQSPLHPDGIQATQLMPASSAAAGFPFSTVDALANTGVVIGEHLGDQTPIIIDRWSWSSHSMARMGMVGSGKSYATKLDILRTWAADDATDIYVVDPKQEYSPVIEAVGGIMHTVTGTVTPESLPETGIHGFTVPDRGTDTTQTILQQVVEALYTATSRNTRRTLVIVDEARILLNTEQGRTALNQFVLEARDTNTAVCLVTQNASHFTQSREGREILDNMPAKQLFRHDRVSDGMQRYFRLSDQEVQTLYELATGTDSVTSTAVIRIADRVNTRIAVRPTATEHRIITGEA